MIDGTQVYIAVPNNAKGNFPRPLGERGTQVGQVHRGPFPIEDPWTMTVRTIQQIVVMIKSHSFMEYVAGLRCTLNNISTLENIGGASLEHIMLNYAPRPVSTVASHVAIVS